MMFNKGNPKNPKKTLASLPFRLSNKLVVLIRQRTIPTEQLPLVGEVIANFRG
jgi:hypothetical protein